jgi:hypothetical protein
MTRTLNANGHLFLYVTRFNYNHLVHNKFKINRSSHSLSFLSCQSDLKLPTFFFHFLLSMNPLANYTAVN